MFTNRNPNPNQEEEGDEAAAGAAAGAAGAAEAEADGEGGEEEEGLEAAENASQNRCMTLAEHANGQQSWKLIKAFYEVADTFPTTRLLVSGAQGRNFSLVSPQVTSLVARYPELKIVTAGVRLFERCSNVLVSVPPSDTQVR